MPNPMIAITLETYETILNNLEAYKIIIDNLRNDMERMGPIYEERDALIAELREDIAHNQATISALRTENAELRQRLTLAEGVIENIENNL